MGEPTRVLVLAASADVLRVVAGLPLGVRAILALHRAGFGPIDVMAGAQEGTLRPALERRGLGESLRWTGDPAALDVEDDGRPVLVVSGDLLFDPAVLAPLLATADGQRVVRASTPGTGLRAVVVPADRLPALVGELDGGRRTLTEALARIRGLEGPAVIVGRGLYAAHDPARPAAALEEALLDDLAGRTAAKDSYLAALIDRRLSRPITRRLLGRPITPTQITVASLALGLLGAAGLATVSYGLRIAGVLALITSVVLDCVDGEVARARFEQSATGARLDVIGDYLVHLAVFTGLGVGLWRQGLPPGGGWATVALVAAVLTTTVTLHRLFVRPALVHGGDLHWTGSGDRFRDSALGAVVEKIASRDYTYLLLVLALLGHLEWFLYAAAVGAWVFVAAVLGYWGYQRMAAQTPAESA
jgi:1L-myo-inositol 1-phosphate cytidylyltransferase / CDP-L-myo-inositol myo-inositolphosphotransferase